MTPHPQEGEGGEEGEGEGGEGKREGGERGEGGEQEGEGEGGEGGKGFLVGRRAHQLKVVQKVLADLKICKSANHSKSK